MSDDQQSEDMRPIPDGGLKDAMPGWLKRPPAWRSMPTAEQRHERMLPEPDTSEIDPRTLVDVSDLPQWLQTIAARGDVPAPEPDGAVEHAIEQVQAASRREKPKAAEIQPEPVVVSDEDSAPEPEGKPEIGLLTDEPTSSELPEAAITRTVFWIVGVVLAGIILIAMVVIFFFLL